MEFHAWYLKEKGWIRLTDSGQYAITVEGVDEVTSDGQSLARGRLIPSHPEEGESDGAGERGAGRGMPEGDK
jgi:curved DNA-binding protein